ncbi:hypothetical protein [Acidovorax sp. HMWF029]|uniref:hypothetical protein n=1 Tax=Acidovorax sp. HMWF029 TaxID=2056863 RepID=UPI0011B2900E|nr:hypothetical protein [Acidovorax sp. HMWF029]
MFTKLKPIILLLISGAASAQTAPVEFKDPDSIRSWFSGAYPSYEIERKKIAVGSEFGEIISIYGMRGSGVVRVDGWFYACADKGWCELLLTVPLGEAKEIKSKPLVDYSKDGVVIKIGKREIARISTKK